MINCFEDDHGGITLDMNAYREPGIVTGDHAFAYLENMRDPERRNRQERDGGYLRLSLNVFDELTAARRAAAKWLEMSDAEGRDWTFELVRLNDAVAGRRHRYSYGFTAFNNHRQVSPSGHSNSFGPGGAVVKMDSETAAADSSVMVWSSPTVFPSEPVFVARPGATAEDDGVLLFLGHDMARRESLLCVLDAQSMQELARVYCGSRCCVSFHGQWIPREGNGGGALG